MTRTEKQLLIDNEQLKESCRNALQRLKATEQELNRLKAEK